VTTRPAKQRAADMLIRAACRRLPGEVRDERGREWSAELLAILHDPGIRIAALRRARALGYAVGVYYSAGRLYRSALAATPAMAVAADDTPGWRAQQANPLAIASLVCGMVALVFGPLAIPAVIFGHIARGQIRRTGEGGNGMVTTGLILGYVSLAVSTTLLAAFLAGLI
jgi:Domain of unknown function (DUF4190)